MIYLSETDNAFTLCISELGVRDNLVINHIATHQVPIPTPRSDLSSCYYEKNTETFYTIWASGLLQSSSVGLTSDAILKPKTSIQFKGFDLSAGARSFSITVMESLVILISKKSSMRDTTSNSPYVDYADVVVNLSL